MLIQEPYLYCGLCFKKSTEKRQYLTSCAHVICQDHINTNTKTCPKCHVHDISIVKLEEGQIPSSIKEIIEPSHEQLNNIQFASKFQYIQLKGLIVEYERQNVMLKEKNGRLKDLLRKSRIELDKCNEYQKEITRLQEENERLSLKLQIGECSSTRGSKIMSCDDEINDITMDEYRSGSSSRNLNKENEDFMSKMKKFNQMKGIEEFKSSQSSRSSGVIVGKNRNRGVNVNSNTQEPPRVKPIGFSDLSSFNIQAESTGIKKRNRSMSLQLSDHSDGSGNGNSNHRLFPLLKHQSPMMSNTAGVDAARKGWYKKRDTSDESVNSSGGSSSGGTLKRMFSFKPPTRSVGSRSGVRIGLGSTTGGSMGSRSGASGVLRSRNDLFKR